MASSTTEDQAHKTSTYIFERFRDQFSFILAQDEETRRRIYRLRYDIYCEELGYEEPADPSRHLEQDEYDAHSIQCLIEHRQSGLAAGCMRLVLPEGPSDAGLPPLPLLQHCADSLNHDTLHPSRLRQEDVCEISRLAISPLFRRRSTDEEIEDIVKTRYAFTEAERQTFPLIVVGLFLATYSMLGLARRPHAFAMMEPRLPRLLRMSGFYFTRVGESIDFHGKRSAFYIDQRQVEKDMNRELLPLYRHIQAELTPQMPAALPKKTVVCTC
ncbi:PEP-CTERM/exosortase system-associated acyltransferase [Halomonas beimenensis]|uniref:PEP-CTERM/exosortase system-associated acyltransferase n=1 Tax=Halomonas beimenensis TaxID=475662 RepID=UPI000BEF193D|nr:PEP-CTERM/exosortase system-associated acyltransferase [Halomonas beimenensis]